MCRLPLQGLPSSGPVSSQQGAQAGHRLQQYDDEFLQFTYKVVPCDKTWRHDYATCPFAHAGESSERRHPSTYLPFMCGSTQHSTDLKEKCPFGVACKYAHGHFELWLHPGRFRTKMCSLGGNCKRPVCFFAHSEHELRVTPYSKLDTAAAVAAQQLAELGQDLDVNGASATGAASLLGGSCSSLDIKVRPGSSINSPGSSINSPGSSECGKQQRSGGSSSTSPTNSLSVDDAAALAKLTASMAALNAAGPATATLLDVGGMARLHQNSAYLAAAAAAVDASLSGSADVSLSSAPGMWPLGAPAMLPQQQQPMAYANGAFLQQQQVPMLDAQLLAGAPTGGDMWLMPPAAAPQWPSVSAAAAARSMLAQQQQQRAYAMNAAPVAPAAGMAPGLPIPTLLAPAGLDQWLQMDGLRVNKDSTCGYPLQAGLCGPPQAMLVQQQQQCQGAADMQQLLNQRAMQQLLGLLDAQSAQ